MGSFSLKIDSVLVILMVIFMFFVSFVVSIDIQTLKDDSDNNIDKDSGRIIVQGGGATFPNRFYQDALFGYHFVNISVEPSVCVLSFLFLYYNISHQFILSNVHVIIVYINWI